MGISGAGPGVTLIRGDTRRLPLADASVDLVVTSPPYWSQRSYQDSCRVCRAARADGLDPQQAFVDYEGHVRRDHHYDGQIGDEPTPAAYIDNLIACTAEWLRVLKPGGSIFVNLGDKYATRYSSVRGGGRAGLNDDDHARARTGQNRTGVPEKSLLLLPERYRIAAVDRLGLIARQVVIWSKPNGLPESVTDRVRRSHEDWVHLVRERNYFAAVDNIREPSGPPKTRGRNPNGPSPDPWDRGVPTITPNPLGKLPGSVREVPTQPLRVPAELGIDHFAAFPMAWPDWIIRGWCPENGTVLDPFGGTGTTALVAHALGRHGISVDMSADYCKLARWRISDPGQVAAAMHVGKPDVQNTAQLDLFEHV